MILSFLVQAALLLMKKLNLSRPVILLLCFCFCFAGSASAQELKNLRVVFVSFSWNNQLPFRNAVLRGFFKAQGLTVEPIFVRG